MDNDKKKKKGLFSVIRESMTKMVDPAVQRQLGITATPALIINNQVKVAGRLPLREEMKKWITGAITERES
jgi:hypothetical protein